MEGHLDDSRSATEHHGPGHARHTFVILALRTFVILAAALALGTGCRRAESPRGGGAASPAPSNPAALLSAKNLGLAYLEADQPEAAAREFRKVIEWAPDDPLGYANLGVAFLRQQHATEALAELEKARERTAGDARREAAICELVADAHALGGGGAPQAAALTRALELDSGRLTAAYKLLQYDAGEPATARAKRNRAALAGILARDPRNLLALLRLGKLELELGNFAAARRPYEVLRPMLAGVDPQVLGQLEEVLHLGEAGNTEDAAVAATMLENLLRAGPAYQAALAILVPPVAGLPLERLRDEDKLMATGGMSKSIPAIPATSGPAPAFTARLLTDAETIAGLASGSAAVVSGSAALAADLDNDGTLELIVAAGRGFSVSRPYGPKRLIFPGLDGEGAGANRLLAADLDHDGDLDLTALLPNPPYLKSWRNNGDGSFQRAASDTFPDPLAGPFTGLDFLDWDGDGDLDLAAAGRRGVVLLDNSRLGTFTDISALSHAPTAAVAGLAIRDDVPAQLWLASAGPTDGDGETMLGSWRPGRDAEWLTTAGARGEIDGFALADLDNDGLLSPLLLAGGRLVEILPGGAARPIAVDDGIPTADTAGPAIPEFSSFALADLDGNGALDVVARGKAGSVWGLLSKSAPGSFIEVRLEGLTQGSSKVNALGIGSAVEIKAGTSYGRQLARQAVTHFGLGARSEIDVLRVVWTNGVPQSTRQPKAKTTVTEKQLLKGSCPYLFAWDGESMRFVTDLLWSSPAGLPFAPGLWAGFDSDEEIVIPGSGLVVRDGSLDLAVTEELWEAAFFDRIALVAVDHSKDSEIVANHKVIPPPYPEPRLHLLAQPRPVAVRDGAGQDLSAVVVANDGAYTQDFAIGPFQGYSDPHSLTLDLGTVAHPELLKLFLTGWIYPTDASINIALAQRKGPPPMAPRLEVETPAGWEVLLPSMGFPGGKTKTIAVELGRFRLPSPVRLRLTTTMWMRWDRIVWSDEPEPPDSHTPRLTPLPLRRADLGERGVSAFLATAARVPQNFRYAPALPSPWRDIPGQYTRTGDVAPLLGAADDRYVIMKPGDEIRLSFDAAALPPLPPGWKRDYVFYADGWDKDFDIHTAYSQTLEPLPFHAMSKYPYAAPERYPDSAAHREYQRLWNTRAVEDDRSWRSPRLGVEQLFEGGLR